jgi:uncharacterized protein (DUF4213/DUF364 family)
MPGEVVREVLTSLERGIPDIANLRVVDARIGLGYTGVKLSTGHVGVCHTLTDETACCQRIDRAGTLSGSPALEIAKLANSWKLAEAVVGIATMNALSCIFLERYGGRYSIIEDADCIDQIGIKKDDTVALAGYIKPFVSIIRSKAKNLYVMERNLTEPDEGLLPDAACEEVIPTADIVIITGTALVNGTIDRLLELSRKAREVAVVGPTASMIPDPLFSRGATMTGGIKVVDTNRLLQVISEGGGVPQFKNASRQIVIRAAPRSS